MAGVLNYVYVIAVLIVAIVGVFYMMWTGGPQSSEAGKRGDYLRAVAVSAFLIYMVGLLIV